jgi:hypothetical protein
MEEMPVLEYQRRDTLSWGIIEQILYNGVSEKRCIERYVAWIE